MLPRLPRHRLQLLDYVVLLAIIIFSSWLMFSTFGYKDGQFVMIGRVWSDFGAHLPLIRSFSMGHNWPPEYPTFPGAPIKYHYLFYAVVGLLEAIGLRPDLALNIPSTLGLILLLWLIYQLTKKFTQAAGAGLLAVILFLFNGTLSIWYTIQASSSIPNFIDKVITAKEWASFGPWDGKWVSAFWNWNIYLNQRHLALSFGLALVIMAPLIWSVIDRHFSLRKWQYPLIYLSFVLFPLLHQAAYVMTVLWCAWWIIWFRKKIPLSLIYFYLFSFGFSLFTHLFLTQNSEQKISFDYGYLSPAKDPLTILTYWWFNLGFYLPLIPIAWLFANRKLKVFFVPFIGFFILANLFRLSPDMINNHKLINFFLIGGNILVANLFYQGYGLINKLSLNKISKSLIVVIVTPILLLPLTASGIADIFPIISNPLGNLDDYPHSPTMQWIMANTPPRSVFMSNNTFYNPALMVGRKLYFDYGYFNWSMGYEDGERRELQKNLFSSQKSLTDLCSALTVAKIDYVLIDRPVRDEEYESSKGSLMKSFQPIFTYPINQNQPEISIYDVAQNCQN